MTNPSPIGNAPQTVYVSIGNSDDKLTQERWAAFCQRTIDCIQHKANAVFGEWYSKPDSRWQNACIAFEVFPAQAESIKGMLSALAREFDQDWIAWAPVVGTEVVAP